MKRYAFIAVFLLGKLTAWSQVIVSGQIVEKAQAPASFATVSLRSVQDSTAVKVKIADESGRFSFESVATGSYQIHITYVGFAKKTTPVFAVKAPVELGSIALEEHKQNLSEVVVKAQKNLVERHNDRLVMNIANSPVALGRNTLEVLGVMPLLSVSPSGGISVRGKSGVLVLIDGRPQQGGLQAILEAMPADEVARIEVITNPPARYDASAGGGVINIVTKKSEKTGFTGTARTTFSQGIGPSLSNTGLTLGYRKKKLSLSGQYFLSARRSFTDETGYRLFTQEAASRIDDNTQSNTLAYTHSMRFSVDYQLHPWHTFRLTYNANRVDNDRRLETRTGFSNARQVQDSTYFTQANWDIARKTDNFGFNYQGKLDSLGREVTFNLTYTPFTSQTNQFFDIDVFNASSEIKQPTQKLRSYNPSSINLWVSQLDYHHPLRKAWDLEAGVKWVRVQTSNTLTQQELLGGQWITNESLSNQSAYVENVRAGYVMTQKKWHSTSLQAGLRAEHTQAQISHIASYHYLDYFPSVNLQQELNADQQLSLSYSRRISRPDYNNMVPFYRLYDRFTASEGNPLLKPQYDNTLELSYGVKNVNLIAGYSYINNFMAWAPRQDLENKITIYGQRNLDHIRRLNLSGSFSHQVQPWWQATYSVWANYDQIEFGNLAGLQAFSRSSAYLGFNTTHTFNLPKSWKFEVTGHYYSPGQTAVYQERSLHAIHLGLAKQLWQKKATLKVYANDITRGSVYRSLIDYQTVQIHSRTYSDSRRLGFTLMVNFGKKTVAQIKEKKLGNESETNRL